MKTTTTGATIDHVIGPEGIFSIRLRDGDIRLRAVDGDAIRVRDTHGRDLEGLFAIELGDGSASISTPKHGDDAWRGHGGRTADLEIDVPRRATVVVDAQSADVEAEGLVGDQRYRTASGDTKLRAVSGRVAVDAVSGDTDIVAFGEADVSIRTVSGDVELRAGTLTALETSTTSGDIRIAGRLTGDGPFAIVTVSGDTLLAPAGDIRIEMTTLSGDLRSKIGGRSEGRRGRRSLEVGSGGPLVTVRSLSGDLLVVPPSPVDGSVAGRPSGSATETSTKTAPAGDVAPPPAANPAIVAAYDDARLRILRSLERGEIDVAEAGRRLEALDGVDGLVTTEGDNPAEVGDALEPATDTADDAAPPDATDALDASEASAPSPMPDATDQGTETTRYSPIETPDA